MPLLKKYFCMGLGNQWSRVLLTAQNCITSFLCGKIEKHSMNLVLDNCQGTYKELFHDEVQIESLRRAETAYFYRVVSERPNSAKSPISSFILCSLSNPSQYNSARIAPVRSAKFWFAVPVLHMRSQWPVSRVPKPLHVDSSIASSCISVRQ